MIKGRKKYVPPSLLDELNNIKVEEGILKDADGFKKIADYSRVGREVKKMRDRFFLNDVFGKR